MAWQHHISTDRDLLERLLARHREKQRKYHTATHVASVVRGVLELAQVEEVDDLGAIVAAAFYHDAVYEPVSPANERASARLARRDLAQLGWDAGRADAVGAMIEGTQHHVDPADTDTAVLFDADLSILGADPAGYGEYSRQIRSEYHHLVDDEWRQGRSDVLRSFVERSSIYATESGRNEWEERARANIAAELALLSP